MVSSSPTVRWNEEEIMSLRTAYCKVTGIPNSIDIPDWLYTRKDTVVFQKLSIMISRNSYSVADRATEIRNAIFGPLRHVPKLLNSEKYLVPSFVKWRLEQGR